MIEKFTKGERVRLIDKGTARPQPSFGTVMTTRVVTYPYEKLHVLWDGFRRTSMVEAYKVRRVS